MHVETIETESLGDRSYVVTDGTVAAVVDPQRDIDRVLAVVEKLGVRVTDVFETHVHNDYVSGGPALAELVGADLHLPADEEVAFPRSPMRHGDEVQVGSLTVRAVHTPGHTPTHLSYVVEGTEGDTAVFTGGSMLFGSVGRTDLVGREVTEHLTREQFRSVRRLAAILEDETEVLPTHGFGSFCSSGETSGRTTSTIGQERRDNQALTIDNEDRFVSELLAGLDDHPTYYVHMAPRNRAGAEAPDLSAVEEVDVAELRRRIHVGEWVVDLRSRRAFAAGHLGGTINVELADEASTHLGWLLPWGTPVTLVGDSPDDVLAMQRQLVRIGIDRPAGRRSDGLASLAEAERARHRVVDFAALRDAVDAGGERPWILDARRRLEWRDGHLPGAHHLPLHELLDRLDEVPDDQPVWVHCASGYRAAIAASLLARSGRRPVLVDGSFDEDARPLFDIVTPTT